MTKIIIYHKKAHFRKEVGEYLQKNGFSTEECYAYAKLDIIVSKAAQKLDQFIFLTDKNLSKDLIEKNLKHLTIEESDSLSEILTKLNAYLIKNVSSKESSVNPQKLEKFDLVIIGSSTGGLPIVQNIVRSMRLKNTTIVICQHIDAENTKIVSPTLLDFQGRHPNLITDSIKIEPGVLYLLAGGSDYKLSERYNKIYVEKIGLSSEFYHPSLNILLSEIDSLNSRKTAIVILSGLGADGTSAINRQQLNNIDIIVQDPKDAIAPGMPQAVIETGKVVNIFKAQQLAYYLKEKVA